MGWRDWDRTTRVGVPILSVAIIVVAALIVGLFAGWWGPNKPDPPPPSTSSATGSPAEPPSPTSSDSSPTPTPTPSPTPTESDEEKAVRQAVLDYYEVRSRLRMDPNANLDELTLVAGGESLEVERALIESRRAKGWRSTKPSEVQNIEVRTTRSDDGKEVAEASYCVNSTGVDVVDSNGESQVQEGRPDLFPTTAILEKQDSGHWIVTRERSEGDACDTE